ncbi:3-oxoacyl-(acyl-carrier-protein) synthase III [Alicyclobacillus hesperidum URH17-3-68]|uniref:Beta-ketoacyl-[acyl-carrier-protein] synthase III n=1 Tax=Alicyclobacillus hesperidum TaxID=89784 RepID=A0A1H2S1J6_9BACL|nr:ketoacyl-ACP synthase III [Alicyclobacillus hesperidum]EJY56510.1 3-oxoacyl-(acyl-carrier-protein) synthase III [Alicyclobacillus hesperidum URH17-3-68]GLV13382.1 3-oxoacyl-[acyl-carrier-protein] synthase 3 protein 2 [Alicyclobacillus hesperidum]SDW25415.1 3-oxoacyl-[acyl-carrier-protein] synthase III [Alicyclobacillus hesperidum]
MPTSYQRPYYAAITAFGAYVPNRIVSNKDLSEIVETTDEWIVQRTGIRERHIADPSEFTSDLCYRAAENMIRRFSVSLADVDMIVVATITPDHPMPSVAAQLQARLGIERAGAIDLSAACAGFVYGIQVATSFVASGMAQKVLVVGGETLSKVTDYADRSTCILFGDGAGACLVEPAAQPGVLAVGNHTVGHAAHLLYRAGLRPDVQGTPVSGNGCIVQSGREVFKLAVQTLEAEVPRLLAEAGLTASELDWFVPHSANLRLIESVCERMGWSMEKTLFSGEWYGNTSSASIPLAIQIAVDDGRIQPGQTLLLAGFGSGFVYAGAVIRWSAILA